MEPGEIASINKRAKLDCLQLYSRKRRLLLFLGQLKKLTCRIYIIKDLQRQYLLIINCKGFCLNQLKIGAIWQDS